MEAVGRFSENGIDGSFRNGTWSRNIAHVRTLCCHRSLEVFIQDSYSETEMQ